MIVITSLWIHLYVLVEKGRFYIYSEHFKLPVLHYNKLVFSRPEEYKKRKLANYEGTTGFSSLLIIGQSTEMLS